MFLKTEKVFEDDFPIELNEIPLVLKAFYQVFLNILI